MTGGTWMRGAVAALVLGVAQAGGAAAATLTVTDTGTLGTGSEVPLSVAAFDTSLGTLTAVAWSLAIDWSAEVTYGNPNAITASVFVGSATVSFDFLSTVEGAGLAGMSGFFSPTMGQEFLFENGLAFAPAIAPGGEATAFAPPRTYSFEGATGTSTGLGAGTLADWQVAGDVGVTIQPATVVSAVPGLLRDERGQLIDLLPFSTRFTESMTATLSVTYTYNPVTGGGGGPGDPVDPVPVVPLPAGLTLMLGGLAALAVVRRRRRA